MLQAPWPADFTLLIADKIYEDMVCMQAWKTISIEAIEGVLDTVRNRLLSFILELEELDPDAGEGVGSAAQLSPQEVSQVFNNYILGSYNVVASGASVIQSVGRHAASGDFHSLERVLSGWGVDDADIRALAKAIESDGDVARRDGFGPKVREWIGRMIERILEGAWKIGLETAPLLLSKAISSYYGWD